MVRIVLLMVMLTIAGTRNLYAQSSLLLQSYKPRQTQGTITDFLDEIKRFSGINLEYSLNNLRSNPIVQLDGSEKTVGAVLQKVLNGQHVQLVEKNNKIILVADQVSIPTEDVVPHQARGYKTAVGLKLYPVAISVKHFLEENRAIEGLFYLWNYGIRLTGLYEIHRPIHQAEGLKWYVGAGAHIGFWNQHWEYIYPDRANSINGGIDGVIGLDYKIKDVPVNISLDWQPSFNIVGYSYFEPAWGGLAIRYTLK